LPHTVGGYRVPSGVGGAPGTRVELTGRNCTFSGLTKALPAVAESSFLYWNLQEAIQSRGQPRLKTACSQSHFLHAAAAQAVGAKPQLNRRVGVSGHSVCRGRRPGTMS